MDNQLGNSSAYVENNVADNFSNNLECNIDCNRWLIVGATL